MKVPVRVRLATNFRPDDPDGRGLRQCWLEVSNAGGAVGFPFPPVSSEQVRKATQRLADDVASGSLRLFIAEDDNGVVGWVSLRLNPSVLARHWGMVERLQTTPERQGIGVGQQLLHALCDDARSIGLEHLRLVLRGSEGLETFYERLGWEEIGRHPGALRLSNNDDRDEVSMMLDLTAEDTGPGQ